MADPDSAWHQLPRPLWENNEGETGVARRPYPKQIKPHLLQRDLECVSQVGQREGNQPRRIIGNELRQGRIERGGMEG